MNATARVEEIVDRMHASPSIAGTHHAHVRIARARRRAFARCAPIPLSERRSIMNQSKRGFGSMDEQKQREIASKGGKASHGGTGREGSSNETKNAGGSSRGGTHEQHVRAGEQSHKNR
jgi:general stress protein YciG